MSTNFSLHNGPALRHWAISKHLSAKQITELADPQGGNTNQQPTSVPSPFARMDLVRAAFLNLGQNADLSGTMNDQRIVSDAFDVGELFFNQEKFKSVLAITGWSPQTDLDGVLLKAPVGSPHRRLGDALQLFLTQDSETYNFGEVKRLFVLSLYGRVVGGTSPKTLFFSSGNNLDWLNTRSAQNPSGLETKIGTHKLFDQANPAPLHTRDIDYQKYWYALQLSMPRFRGRFQELDDYLTRSKTLLQAQQPTLFEEHIQAQDGTSKLTVSQPPINGLSAITGTLEADFAPLEITPGNPVEVLGQALYTKKSDAVRIGAVSDFIIKSPKFRALNPGALMPMVLQPNFYSDFMYLPQTRWDPATLVPPYVPQDWRTNARPLPGGQPGNYPWLTVSDLLEPYLIRLPYALNRTRFFDGNAATLATAKGYLLPLTSTFFDFFNVEDVQNGTVQLRMEPLGDGIKVILRVPVLAPGQSGNQYITLDRVYFATPETDGIPLATGSMPVPNPAQNKGVIVEDSFTLNLYPFIRSGNVIVKPDYRVQLIESGENKRHEYDLSYVRQSDNTAISPALRRPRTERSTKTDGSSRYDVVQAEFDYMRVGIRRDGYELRGVLIPKWQPAQGGARTFAFAIDFGTTNTHIEYSINGGLPQPFDVAEQVATLVAPEQYNTALFELFLLFDLEFVPAAIGPGRADSFPTRTVIAESPTLNFNNTTASLTDFNIPFYFDRQPADPNLTTTNLKWLQADTQAEKRVSAFLGELLLLIKNAVLQKGGNPNETKIVWFYPASMGRGRTSNLAASWRELYEGSISEAGATEQLSSLSESIAPYYYFRQDPNYQANERPVVNIDIGGGTSDVVVYEKDGPTLITSCRFAGNAVYGDGLNTMGNAAHNGFVRKYKDRIPPLLTDSTLAQLSGMNARKSTENRSEDIVSFWFSLERNVTAGQRNALSFNRMLAKDDDLKIVFVLFYVALVYHVAKLMKAQGELDLPGAVTFSGMGSKLLTIIAADESILRDLTAAIFEEVYQRPFPANSPLLVRSEQKNPKEATCKGALMPGAVPVNTDELIHVYAATHNDEFSALTYADLERPAVQASLLGAVEEFIESFKSLNQRFSFNLNLNVTPNALSVAYDELPKNLNRYLLSAIQQKLNEVKASKSQTDTTGKYKNAPVEETLFFYPLIGAINNLANVLVK